MRHSYPSLSVENQNTIYKCPNWANMYLLCTYIKTFTNLCQGKYSDTFELDVLCRKCLCLLYARSSIIPETSDIYEKSRILNVYHFTVNQHFQYTLDKHFIHRRKTFLFQEKKILIIKISPKRIDIILYTQVLYTICNNIDTYAFRIKI